MSAQDTNNSVQLSQKEISTLIAAFVTSDTLLKPNFEEMAEQVGYSNAKSAATMWGNLRRKLSLPAGKPGPKRAVGSNNSPKKANAAKADSKKAVPGKSPASTTAGSYLSIEDEDEDDHDGEIEESLFKRDLFTDDGDAGINAGGDEEKSPDGDAVAKGVKGEEEIFDDVIVWDD